MSPADSAPSRELGTVGSLVPALLSALRELPPVAEATARFCAAVNDESLSVPAPLRRAAWAALHKFIATFEHALPLQPTLHSHRDPAPNGAVEAQSVLRENYGFIPKVFQAQQGWPELLAAEARLLEVVVFDESTLPRYEAERLLLTSAVANRNDYGIALHFGILKLFGEEATATRVVRNGGRGEDPLQELVWAAHSSGTAARAAQALNKLVEGGLSHAESLKILAVCAIGNLLHSLQSDLQPALDFPLPSIPEKVLYPGLPPDRPTAEKVVRDDPDAPIIARVKGGEVEAFAELVRQHTRKVFATLLGLLGDAEEARDVSQEAFLKAFENLHRFEGRSKFSSWLMSIAINTGTEALRKRRNFEPIDTGDEDEEWHPRQIQEWSDNPEECFAKAEMRELVRKGVMRLPGKYRVALLVRDVSQLSTEEAADALGVSVPALKARVLRGRLMLREALAPHFEATRERGTHG